ncbi:hypothetical protein SteCoe_11748 [Stentor coeruleus]|uniref:Uncharacterized protein n=1 Tax=Stentor coeruleus TaxID=5963 RepID=A0A1R2CCB7_9CILI|nr:hypothetical protein SteCoe_11748 [Stentor coeruleus]
MESELTPKFLATLNSSAFQKLLTIKNRKSPTNCAQKPEIQSSRPSIPKSPQSNPAHASYLVANKLLSSGLFGIKKPNTEAQNTAKVETIDRVLGNRSPDFENKKHNFNLDILKLQSHIKTLQNDIGPRSQTPSNNKGICTTPECLESGKSSPGTVVFDTKGIEIDADTQIDKCSSPQSSTLQSFSIECGRYTTPDYLHKQLEIEKQNAKYFEDLYYSESQNLRNAEKEIDSLKAEIEVLKSSSDIQKTRLFNEIKSLKNENLDLTNQLRQRNRESLQYNYNTMLKKSATNISDNTLEEMEKKELVNQFLALKKDYHHLSKQLLRKADELFEKSTEIKQVNKQKAEMYKELILLKEQVAELSQLKEHVGYLLNLIQNMRVELTNLAEKYEEGMKLKGFSNSEEFINHINHIANTAKTKVECITDKSRNPQLLKWINDKNKSKLIQTIKKSIFEHIKN